MQKTKRHSPIYKHLIAIVKSRRARDIVAIIYLFFAFVAMICIDERNDFRHQYMPFLDNTWVIKFFEWFRIERYNITASSWVIFMGSLTVVTVIVVGNILSPRFVQSKVEKNRTLFSSESKVRLFYTVIWWASLLLISAIIIGIMAFLGAFGMFNANHVEKSPFVSLGYACLILAVLLFTIPLAILIVYLVFKLIFTIITYFYGSVVYFKEDVQESMENDRRAALLNGASGASGEKPNDPNKPLQNGAEIFPSLVAIDNENVSEKEPIAETSITLEEFVKRFQSFAANKHRIYYELPMLRRFIAGLAASRLIILEGISGTGKSMLPRMFKEFTGSDSFFMPIQATWRDKSDVLGFYSEFTQTFKPTPFLEKLYAASYSDRVNVMVLDEMNLSRVEYYFADFLSVLEYPEEDWKIKIYSPDLDQTLPKKLDNGFVTIPANTWFVGTANTDDSTFTITDKVCDRAVILNFEDRFGHIESEYESEPISISAKTLIALFQEAMDTPENCLSDAELKKFEELCEFVKDRFEILFGNRIMVQIEKFVPVFVALGGTKEEALDFMFAKKILRKLDGKFQEYQLDELLELNNYLAKSYGKGVFCETERIIKKMTKRFM